MAQSDFTFGILDNRFLARSIGLLDPPSPITVSGSEPVQRALELLKEHKVGCVMVTDETGRLSGIFSERDVVLKVVLSSIDYAETPVADVMTAKPHAAQMTTPIAYALNMMSQGGFRHIPVVDEDNYPVGIVSVKNIVDFIVRSLTKDLSSLALGA